MQSFAALAIKNIKEIWRDKKILVTSLLFPILLLFVSQFILKHTAFFTENIPLAVINPEPAFPNAGRLLVLSLEHAVSSHRDRPIYAIEELRAPEAFQKLHDGAVTGILAIPRGFTKKLSTNHMGKLTLILNDADPRSGILAGSLTAFINRFGLQIKKSRGEEIENLVTLSTVKQGQATLPPEVESLANVTLFAFLFLIPYAAGQWVSEMERGSLTRFRLSNTSPAQLFGGVFLSTLFLGLLQSALLLSSSFLFGLRPYFLLIWIWPLAFVLVPAAMGLGLILSSFLEKEKQLHLFSSLILIPLFLFSGSLGKELGATKWIAFLPWSQGYSILREVLSYQLPDARLIAQVSASSLALAALGALLFSWKRLLPSYRGQVPLTIVNGTCPHFTGQVASVVQVSKTYPNGTQALSDVSLALGSGECIALLGPNGAGKTTLIKILTRIFRPDCGEVAGPSSRSFGVALQDIGLWPHLTVLENLAFVGNLYGMEGSRLKTMRDNLIEELDLAEYQNSRFENLSEGIKRRVNLACALIHNPEIVILDEPSLGLDVHARMLLWKYLEGLLRAQKTSLLLSTHDMEEADRLGQRIAILDHGKLQALDSPHSLKSKFGRGTAKPATLADVFLSLTGHSLD